MKNPNEKYKFLRKKGEYSSDVKWTLNSLKEGLDYFFEINGRYPTVKEIDIFEYLPTSRTIQRSFGGLMSLRCKLQLDTPINFSRGITRSNMAKEGDLRAKEYEERFYAYLISQVDEIRVHEHKIMRPGNTAVDFFIYRHRPIGIAIDLFYSKDMHSFGGVVNIKSKKYEKVEHDVYFVIIGNNEITQKMIDEKINNRKNQLAKHICVLTEDKFKEQLSSILI